MSKIATLWYMENRKKIERKEQLKSNKNLKKSKESSKTNLEDMNGKGWMKYIIFEE